MPLFRGRSGNGRTVDGGVDEVRERVDPESTVDVAGGRGLGHRPGRQDGRDRPVVVRRREADAVPDPAGRLRGAGDRGDRPLARHGIPAYLLVGTVGRVDTAERLIRSTQELLWERGYVGTSPKAIQQRAEAGQGSMYHHFTGKPDLARQAIRRSAQE